MHNLYETLGIDKSALADDIKKAYRKLASKHHPDKGGDTARFQEIQNAYDILSDTDKRSQYDSGGFQQTNQRSSWKQGNNPFGGFGSEFDDLRDFFAHATGQQRPQRNKDVSIDHSLSLNDSLAGKKETIRYQTTSGKQHIIELNIPAFVASGFRIRYAGQGDDGIIGAPRGDLLVDIKLLLPSGYWVEHGNLLCSKINVSVWQALVGDDYVHSTFDGKTFKIKIPAGTQPGTKFKLSGQGMMISKIKRGDLCLVANVEIPAIIQQGQVDMIKTFINHQ